ncbi:serine/threonine protein kinase [Salmonella enterica subsp. enterica serovar Javiana]|nr:serine/threonine protein kinase [Salmonella enterica subsp. enterica serovar Javiana]EBV2938467.1 serine/threonine protein kinase [Salmonella enterica subsp. enterica serovar Javiana]
MYQARIHVAHLPSSCSLLCFLRSCSSWHYPISPKNRKTALRPCPVWLQRGSAAQKDPLRIWFYPQ